jgi:hypothetical protein
VSIEKWLAMLLFYVNKYHLGRQIQHVMCVDWVPVSGLAPTMIDTRKVHKCSHPGWPLVEFYPVTYLKLEKVSNLFCLLSCNNLSLLGRN